MIRTVARPNIYTDQFEYDESDPAGYRGGMARVGDEAGGQELIVKLFELPAGEALCPYHYEYVEEWLVILDGELTLRAPDGEHQLERGEVIRFPAGPEGAHQTTNNGQSTARFLMFSSARTPSVSVYPDSDKIGVWPGDDRDNLMLRRGDGHVDYYDGEVGR